MTEQIIILGWDALDAELIAKYDVADGFGQHYAKIDTYVNPVVDEPLTKELWPSMITGLHPDEHGIHGATESEGIEWGNPLLNFASTVANGVVPKSVLNAIGKRLRERGAALEQKRERYYPQNDLETVCDGPGRIGMSIPNYETDYDREHELDGLRDDVWGQLLANRDGTAGFEPAIDSEGVYDVLGSALGKRVGHTLAAASNQYALTWMWFGCLDTVGHIAPAMSAPVERDWYQATANVTELIRDATPDETTVIAVSDHGLQDGNHTKYATIASNDPQPVAEIDHVFEIADWINAYAGNSVEKHEVDDNAMETVRGQLRNLGYIQ